MSWDGYVTNLMVDGKAQESAIVGYGDSKGVWAASPGGILARLTVAEIDVLTGSDRNGFFINGLTLGGQKCSVIRDRFDAEDEQTMDIKTKAQEGEPKLNITVAKALKTLVIVMGQKDTHGGIINKKAYEMADYLRKNGY